jgi:hypothetical protein
MPEDRFYGRSAGTTVSLITRNEIYTPYLAFIEY